MERRSAPTPISRHFRLLSLMFRVNHWQRRLRMQSRFQQDVWPQTNSRRKATRRIVVDLHDKTTDLLYSPGVLRTGFCCCGPRHCRLVATIEEKSVIRRPIRTAQPAPKEGARVNE